VGLSRRPIKLSSWYVYWVSTTLSKHLNYLNRTLMKCSSRININLRRSLSDWSRCILTSNQWLIVKVMNLRSFKTKSFKGNRLIYRWYWYSMICNILTKYPSIWWNRCSNTSQIYVLWDWFAHNSLSSVFSRTIMRDVKPKPGRNGSLYFRALRTLIRLSHSVVSINKKISI